jgi:hypothetical protein
MRVVALLLSLAFLSGCTALTDFDRFHFGAELELVDAGPYDPEPAESGEPLADAGELGELVDGSSLPDAEHHQGEPTPVEDAGALPAPRSLTGRWQVDRTVQTTTCEAPNYTAYIWTITEQPGGAVTVQLNSPPQSVQTLAGTHKGDALELTGKLGSNTITVSLTLVGPSAFVGDEHSSPSCPTHRRVEGQRL